MKARPPALETALRWGIHAGIGLVLLTPFIVTKGTLFPFVVGKALWSRSVIEIVFALWAVLALSDPAWRPPRSRVLLLFAAVLGVSFLAALCGVAPQRSLWSDYERMQGVVDLAHWFALAVVLASVLRTRDAWRRLLAASAGAATAVAGLAVARHLQLDVPFYGVLPEGNLPRIGGPLGNPLYLSAYLLVNLMIAAGLAVRSWLSDAATAAAPAPAPPASRNRRRERRRKPPRAAVPARPVAGRVLALLWTLAALLQLWGMALAGSVGGFGGLFAAAAFVAFALAVTARGRTWRLAAGMLAVLGLAVAAIGFRFVAAERAAVPWLSHPAARYVATVHLQRPGVQSRLAAWRAGLEGFAARPVLGWGPGNFETVFGRFASGYGATAKPHDYAHGKLVEVAAATGAPGVAAYLALWAWCLTVLWRAAGRAEPPDRALMVLVGGAAVGGFAQSQLGVETATGSLLAVLLLGFAASLEESGSSTAHRYTLAAWLRDACAAPFRAGGMRSVLGAAAVLAAAAGLAANLAIFAAADKRHVPRRGAPLDAVTGGIDGFRPLANTYRWWLFDAVTRNWRKSRAADEAGSRRLLRWVEREAAEVRRLEPERWRYYHSLARMYAVVASTEPDYREKARRAFERARSLAPNRAVFHRPLTAPKAVEARRREDGRHELRWQGSAGAGYHVVAQTRADGGWLPLLHSYDPARTSFVRPRRVPPGTYRYRIKACRSPGNCTAWTPWPAVEEPPPGPAGGRR